MSGRLQKSLHGRLMQLRIRPVIGPFDWGVYGVNYDAPDKTIYMNAPDAPGFFVI
jgi:hypothetical protein